MSNHLIYHPKRVVGQCAQTIIYFDKLKGNQDPYIWNSSFLHTFCHMTELRNPEPGDVNFWVSGDNFPEFNHLYCDLVFVVSGVYTWRKRNCISLTDPMVDSRIAYKDHYRWARCQHHFKKRRRKTLKADPRESFQPQTSCGKLIDVVPMLALLGQLSLEDLRCKLRKSRGSKPMPICQELARSLYGNLKNTAIRLTGADLQAIRTSDQWGDLVREMRGE